MTRRFVSPFWCARWRQLAPKLVATFLRPLLTELLVPARWAEAAGLVSLTTRQRAAVRAALRVVAAQQAAEFRLTAAGRVTVVKWE
jgi:hypothetical protein